MSYQGLSFGDCSNCRSVKANWCQLSMLGNGEGWRIECTLLDPVPLPADMVYRELRLLLGQGWSQRNMWDGTTTLSHPEFQGPYIYETISDDGHTHIGKELAYSPTLGYFDLIWKTITTTWGYTTPEEKENKIRDDIVNRIPWNNPYIYDLEHCIGGYWKYDTNGNLELIDTIEGNPFNYVFTGGCRSWSVYHRPGEIVMTGIRFRKRKLVQHRLADPSSVYLPEHNNGLIGAAPGRPMGNTFTVNAGEIVLPPSSTSMDLAGREPDEYGHTSTIVC